MKTKIVAPSGTSGAVLGVAKNLAEKSVSGKLKNPAIYKDHTIIGLSQKQMAIVFAPIPQTSRFALIGGSYTLPRNSHNFTRLTIGSFWAFSSAQDIRTIGHLAKPEYDINNWMITTAGVSDMTEKVTGYSEIFMIDPASALISKPYLLLVYGPTKWFWTNWNSTNYEFPQFELDMIDRFVTISTAIKASTTGVHTWPGSNIQFRKEWLKLFYFTTHNLSRLPNSIALKEPNNGGSRTYTSTALFGNTSICLHGDLFHWKAGSIYRTTAYSSIWDEYAKFAKRDPTSGIKATWPAGVYKIGDAVTLTIADISASPLTATIRSIIGDANEITYFWVESTNDAAGVYRRYEFYGIEMSGYYDSIENEYHLDEITYGYFTYLNDLLFQTTTIHYDTIGFDQAVGAATSIADAADVIYPEPTEAPGFSVRRLQLGFYNGRLVQGQSADADTVVWNNGINRNNGVDTVWEGRIYNYAILTENGLEYYSGDPGSTVQYTHDHKALATYNGTETLTNLDTIIRTHSVTSHIHGHIFSWTGVSTCVRTPLTIPNEVCTFSIGWGLGWSSNNDRDAYIQYTMDGRTVVQFTSNNGATVQATRLINSIIQSDQGMGSYDSPGGVSMGTRGIASGDNAIDWTPYDGNRFSKSSYQLNTHIPEGDVFPDSRSIDLVTIHGGINAISEDAANDNVSFRQTTGADPQVSDPQYLVGLQGKKGYGGVTTSGTGTVPLDIYLVDIDFQKIGRFSMNDDNSLWSVLSTYMADQYQLNSNADTYEDPELTIWLNAGNILADFEPELDENEDYVHAPSAAYQTLVDGILTKRKAVDDILATQVIHNDFMSYELLSFWAKHVGTDRPLASYVLHANDQNFTSVAF